MDDFTERPIEVFLDSLAARSATPGGGSAAALAGALACAMARMVMAYSTGRESDDATEKRIENVLGRLTRSDHLLRALLSEDAIAYAEMTACRKAAKSDPTRQADYDDAVMRAIGVPLEMAAAAADTLSTLDEIKESANRHLLSDLGVAAVLAEACAQAAWYSVRVNLSAVQDAGTRDKILADANQCLARCGKHRTAIDRFVRDHLEKN